MKLSTPTNIRGGDAGQEGSSTAAPSAPDVAARHPSIELRGVTMRYRVPKRYRDYLLHPLRPRSFMALRGVELRVLQGQSIAVLGPNGSGKTTLLKLMGGLLYPSEGTVRVNGRSLCDRRGRDGFKAGFVLNEERSFYWRLTGRQNLEFFGALDELHGRALRHRIDEVLDMVGMADLGHKPVSDCSSGMRQRLAIARALLAEPDVLILDEPTRSLDPIGALELRETIRRQVQARATMNVVLATHCLDEAQQLCRMVCVLRGGILADSTTVDQAVSRHGSMGGYYASIVAGAGTMQS